MFIKKLTPQLNKRMKIMVLGIVIGIHAGTAGAASLNFPDSPLFLELVNTPPLVMLSMSRDHQLFNKAYNDYSDLNDDDTVDTTYNNNVEYFGYFDPDKCYDYDSGDGRFEPKAFMNTSYYCDDVSGSWSGNFLNWVSTARIDALRKILYGGLRSTDGAGTGTAPNKTSTTVLERTQLPHDAHAWAKYYNGSDIAKLTPFTGLKTDDTNGGDSDDVNDSDEGITFCNTTEAGSSSTSTTTTAEPLIRAIAGNYSLWDSNERWQCTWSGDHSASNANVAADSGIDAASSSPSEGSGLTAQGGPNYIARVLVCSDSSLINATNNENCQQYPDGNYKPVGVLQEHGEDGSMEFGLMTGSYKKNFSGGVLRKNIGNLDDEINIDTDGTFKSTPSTGSIVKALSALRLFGYQYSDGQYLGGLSDTKDNCPFDLNDSNLDNIEGRCRSWGNPIGEIYTEALRYFAGNSATSAFNADDSSIFSDLKTVTWTDPLSTTNQCAPLVNLVINASTSSYDDDDMSIISSLQGATTSTAETFTTTIGDEEGITGNDYFVGHIGTETDASKRVCSAKTVTDLADARGICPEGPSLLGTYQIAGAAYYAHTNDIRALAGTQTVDTLAVSLSTDTPSISIPVPGSTDTVTLLPAFNQTREGNYPGGGLVNFSIVKPYTLTSATRAEGKVYINWEVNQWGSDYDQDLWGTLNYTIDSVANTITVTTETFSKSAGAAMLFGYVVNGTTEDGFHAVSGANGRNFDNPIGNCLDPVSGTRPNECVDCKAGNETGGQQGPQACQFTLGTSTASLLEEPLFYTAKWGGFVEDDDTANDLPDLTSEWDSDSDGTPDNYFFVTNPGDLKESLEDTFDRISELTGASSTAVAVNSTVLRGNARLYQAQFSSVDWSGSLSAFAIDNDDGTIIEPAAWTEIIPPFVNSSSGRSLHLFTMVDKSGTPTAIEFDDTDDDLSAAVGGGSTTAEIATGDLIINYVSGDQSKEESGTPGGLFRDRTTLLGDIVNSSPISAANTDFVFNNLPTPEGTSYDAYVNAKTSYFTATVAGEEETFSIIYVGANDGMLHAFKDTEDTSPSVAGTEIFGYVPSAVHSNLADLTDPNYSHRFYVDATPNVSDIYDFTAGKWITMLAGTLGYGGRQIYALDVSDPLNFSTGDVMWEYDSSDNSELGHVMAAPAIVRLNNGAWGVVVGNGYNSASQKAQLIILNAETGALIKQIDTDIGSSGSPNGLARPFMLDTDGDRIADFAYAGDLKGNMWKFDLTGSNTSQWDVAYKQGSTPEPLYTASDDEDTSGTGDDTPQAITTRPVLVNHPDGGYVVLFGTGKYLETDDNIIAPDPQTQTFYGIRDNGVEVSSSGLTNLKQQSILSEQDIIDDNGTPADTSDDTVVNTIRVVSDNVVDYTNFDGWYLELVSPVNGEQAERVISNPLVRFGRVIFPTFIPSANCEDGGATTLMELDAVSGARLENSVFDVNDDGVIDSNDFASYSGNQVPGSGIFIPASLASPAVVSAEDASVEFKLSSGMSGEVTTTRESTGSIFTGRQSWRQLR